MFSLLFIITNPIAIITAFGLTVVIEVFICIFWSNKIALTLIVANKKVVLWDLCQQFEKTSLSFFREGNEFKSFWEKPLP
jgi:hypothetical protein